MKIAAMLFRRTGNGLALLVAVLVLNFTLIHIAPGDVADTIAGDMGGADAEIMEQIRRDYGLDRPFHEQLFAYMAKVARFDLGHSYFFTRPVTELLLERVPATLLLVLSAQILAVMMGTVLGVIAARRPNGLLSHGVSATRQGWSRGNGVCDDPMKPCLSSSGCETRPAKGEPARPVASLAPETVTDSAKRRHASEWAVGR